MQSKFTCFSIIIEKLDTINNKEVEIHILLDYLRKQDCYVFWCLILHDKDIDTEGVLIRPHYHIVVKCKTSYTKNTILNDVAKALLININCISCIGLAHFVESVRYLTHAEKVNKVEYDLWDIYSSDTEDLISIYDKGVSAYELDINYLIDMVYKHKMLTTLYKELGMKNVRLYRPIISDLWKEKSYK